MLGIVLGAGGSGQYLYFSFLIVMMSTTIWWEPFDVWFELYFMSLLVAHQSCRTSRFIISDSARWKFSSNASQMESAQMNWTGSQNR